MNSLNKLSDGRLVEIRTQGQDIFFMTLDWMEKHPDLVEVIADVSIVTILAVSIYFFRRYRWRRGQRKDLEKQVGEFQSQISELQDKIVTLEALELKMLETTRDGGDGNGSVRIWMDGAFDMMHYGHMNAFRKGKVLGTYLIVGVNSDESIAECKGPPVLNMKERMAMVHGVKWVDQVVTEVPYVLTDKYLREIIEKYQIDYVVHGDDPCIVDGKDVYEGAKRINKYRSIPRTDGVSTTDIVGRMLLLTRNHHNSHTRRGGGGGGGARPRSLSHLASIGGADGGDEDDATSESESDLDDDDVDGDDRSVLSSALQNAGSDLISRHSHFLTTSHILTQFSAGVKAPEKGSKVVYIAGSWDMFHAGHLVTLQLAREQGDYLVVGVHNDAVVNTRKGSNLPIMSMQERVLSVSGCKWCDDVLLDAPAIITEEVIAHLKIDIVCHIRMPSASSGQAQEMEYPHSKYSSDPYAVARAMGKLVVLEAPTTFGDLHVHAITGRIQTQRERYEEKITRKKKQEQDYYDNKFGAKADNGGGDGK
jgi:ethanolamine-phosphate cytidylyltransferase